MFDEQLVTVWSAPNYCYRCGNMASIMTVHESGEKTFAVYGPAPENDRDKGMQTRRMVSRSCALLLLSERLWICRDLSEQHAILCLISRSARCHAFACTCRISLGLSQVPSLASSLCQPRLSVPARSMLLMPSHVAFRPRLMKVRI